MATRRREARRRNRFDIAVIVASVWALVAAIRIPPEVMTGEGAEPVVSVPWLLAAHAAGGLLGLGGLVVAQRWPPRGRALVALGGLALLAGFLALRTYTFTSILSLGLPAAALLVAAPFAGPMPTLAEEGKR